MTKTIAHKVKTASHNGTRIARSELKGLVERSKTALTHAEGQASEELDTLKSSLRDRLGNFRTAVSAKVKTIAKTARKKVSRADDAIRSNPYPTIGVAAGAGIVAGVLIARRRSR